ncbi:gephyrin-like molybdotransferase Glp [Oerskovia flava]|uniref:molybdopterin molybdotransferase MoeA n=1 Tax=Oerskovia flava TaxID=2986422 RepID=UPI002240CCE7|nr:gephyrin-like molybdotransferase Glp [Oerskovia sp. JB1-3-2]
MSGAESLPEPLSVAAHLERTLGLVEPLPGVRVPLDDALGAVLAEDLHARLAVPPFDASAMDGYAVRADDVAHATPERPVRLDVVADLAAAPESPAPAGVFRLGPGQAARIMTGAPVPDGCDAVVPVERTSTRRFVAGATTRERTVAVHALGRTHIRRRGEDVEPGDLIARAGAVLTPRLVSAAASIGHGDLPVHRAPRVVVLSTGSELVPARTAGTGDGTRPDDPGPGQIPDSNSFLLAACARDAGAVVDRVGAVPDTPDALYAALEAAARDADLLVTSGGVSAGAFDVVKEVLLGGDDAVSDVQLVAVGMQPGKPQALARWRGVPWIAVPGNPVAAFVSFEAFVRPAIGRLRGLADPARPLVERVAAEGWRSPPGREQFVPVVHTPQGQVVPAAVRKPGGGSGSHLVSSLARADAVAVVGADVDEVRPGDTVRVMVIA